MPSDLSDVEQAKIVRHFMLNSPPGQFSNVQRDLEQIVESEGLVERILPKVAKKYNEEQMLVCSVPDSDTKFLITQPGRVGENEYLEPGSNKVVDYDHIKKAAGEVRDATEAEMTPADAAGFRDALSDAFTKYVGNYYPDGVGVCYAKEAEGGGFDFSACLSATKTNLSNRWSGRIRSTYKCTLSPGDGDVEIAGKMVIQVHYFEEGNVQLNTKNQPTLKCKGVDPEEFASTFVSAVEKHEQTLHQSLFVDFNKLSADTFKGLRRKLPLTGKKFDFEHSDQYALGGEMKGQ